LAEFASGDGGSWLWGLVLLGFVVAAAAAFVQVSKKNSRSSTGYEKTMA
jgi:hypothetical protein